MSEANNIIEAPRISNELEPEVQIRRAQVERAVELVRASGEVAING
jgi:hypothetical protein